MTQINVGMNFGREFEGELKAARAGAAIGNAMPSGNRNVNAQKSSP